ncbi:quercetin 2,3-dioxygenase [Streptomyces sp. NPDC002851]
MTLIQPWQAGPEDGRAIWHMGALMRFKAVGEDTGGQFWLAEQISDKGYASPLHRHTREDELFIVLDGELTVGVGDKTLETGPGAMAYAPRHLPHQFRVESEKARFLILTTPAGFEEWFFETGIPAGDLTEAPVMPEEGPPDVGKLLGSLAKYGVEFLAPPPGAPPMDGPPPGAPPSS